MSIDKIDKSEKLRYGKNTALLFTIVFMSCYFYGLRALYVTAVSAVSSVAAEYFACVARRKKYDWSDTSPIMSAVLLALLMPASVPYTVIAFASAFMATVCKHAFGGNGNLIFNPVCVSYIFTTFCFPSDIVRYPEPIPFGSLDTANRVSDALGHSYTYALDNGTSSAFSLLDIIWGKLAGPMGTSSVLIILIAGIALYFLGDIPTAVFFAGFGANVLLNVLFPFGETGWYAVLNSLAAGSYLFTLVFLACDLRFVPKRDFSQILYGIAFAGSAFLIRKYTSIENSGVFALPALNIFCGELDRLTDALERFALFLWKWIRIISALAAKKIWKFTVVAAKWAAKAFDRFCEYVAGRIVERKKRQLGETDSDKDRDNNKARSDENALQISGIVGIVSKEDDEEDETAPGTILEDFAEISDESESNDENADKDINAGDEDVSHDEASDGDDNNGGEGD